MAQVSIPRFRPDERAELVRRVQQLEQEVMRLQEELRFILTHLDKYNFDPDVWARIGGGGDGA